MSLASAEQVPAVWVGEADAHANDAARALTEWARARGIVLSSPEPRAPGISVDPALADDVEKELARARDALEPDAADRALARAEATLRAHPELPNAAWLEAEVLRARGDRTTDKSLAAALWQDAAALDGGRVPGIGEAAAPKRATYPLSIQTLQHGAPPQTPPPPLLPGQSAAPPVAFLAVRVDGAAPTGSVLEGEHAVVASSGDRIVYAAWVSVREPTTVTIPQSDSPCASEALATARREGDRIVAPGVSCPAWVAAVPGDKPSSVLVARCVQDACSPLASFRLDQTLAAGPPQARDQTKNAWPAWATWTSAGIGAAAVLAVVLVASGIFESRPVEQRFVIGGTRQE